MKRFLPLLFLTGLLVGQDIYPFYSDPNKQTKFEDKKIYIIEKSGKEQHFSGGDSYTELANTWGYVLLDEDPDYVVTQTPLTTYYEYYYEFKIKQGNKELTELEFLLTAGYNTKAKKVYDIYERKMRPYNRQYAVYEKELNNYLANNRTIKDIRWVSGETNIFTGLFLISGVVGAIFYYSSITTEGYCASFGEQCDDELNFILGSVVGFAVAYYIPQKEKYQYETMSIPSPPSKPSIVQVLSNEQIKSLAESYNRRLYEEIKTSN